MHGKFIFNWIWPQIHISARTHTDSCQIIYHRATFWLFFALYIDLIDCSIDCVYFPSISFETIAHFAFAFHQWFIVLDWVLRKKWPTFGTSLYTFIYNFLFAQRKKPEVKARRKKPDVKSVSAFHCARIKSQLMWLLISISFSCYVAFTATFFSFLLKMTNTN